MYTDLNPNDSNTPSDYKWSKIKGEKGEQGIQGLQGEKGEQGIQGEKGEDGRTSYFHIKYSVNANGNPMIEVPSTYIGTYVDFTEKDSNDYTKYTWARFEGIQGEKGEQGIPGANGENGQTSYLHIAYANSSDGSVGFSVSDSTNKSYIGQYTDFEQNDSTDYRKYSWTKIKGEQGDGYTQMGQWYDGMVVPKMGVVSMGGGSYVAKAATSNPPLWTILDNQGRRLKSNKGYILTGGINTAEYDVWAEKGEQGDKGDKGEQGIQGSPGATGAQGKQGIEGCIVRDSEWTIGTEYRNDSNITDGSLAVRYVDVALVRNNATATGWDAYRCMRTHVASSSITYTNTSYWEKFSTNVGAIFTSLIIAKNAKIQFLQGNQLTIQKSDGTITAGLSGSDAGQKIRIWAGGNNPDTATFKVSETGEMWATNAHLQGEVAATSGSIGGIKIENGYIGTNYSNSGLYISNDMVSVRFSSTVARIGYDVGGVFSVGTMAGYFSCNETGIEGVPSTNVGLYVTASGAKAYDNNAYLGNHALYIPQGDICGFRLRTRRVNVSMTLDKMDSNIIAVTKDITLTLPTSNVEDGQEYRIRNHTDGTIYVSGKISSLGYPTSETTKVHIPAGKLMFVFYDKVNSVWLANYCEKW